MRAAAMLVVVGITIGPLASNALADGTSTPTIQTDSPDYNPGQMVNLTGSGWVAGSPGEHVHIHVNATDGQTYSTDGDVNANTSGAIAYSFRLPTTYIASYLVTATGDTSGTVTTTFTDANPTRPISTNARTARHRHHSDGCEADSGDWVKGNVDEAKSTYSRGTRSLTACSLTILDQWLTHGDDRVGYDEGRQARA